MFYDENFLEEGGWTSFHCQDTAHTLLVSLGNEGSVAQVDRRVGTSAVSTFNLFDRLHAKSISCNPSNAHQVATGTNKGGCFIYDLRSTRKSSGLLTPLVELQGASRLVSEQELLVELVISLYNSQVSLLMPVLNQWKAIGDDLNRRQVPALQHREYH